MRNTYTCIFRKTLSSRVWTLSAAARCIWLWMQLSADPEGYVVGDIKGIAEGARVPLDLARQALCDLLDADPDAAEDDPYSGRILERVVGGWRLLGFEEQRELAKVETRKARHRAVVARARMRAKGPANDNGDPETVTVTPPKQTPKPISANAEDPPTPFEAPSLPVPLHVLPDDWAPSEALRADAVMAGVKKLDQRIAQLRTGPIGGTRGVLPNKLDAYVRGFFGKWRSWDDADAAKALPNPFTTEHPKRIKGLPAWVREEHREVCAKHGWDLKAYAKVFAEGHHIPPKLLQPNDAANAFSAFLANSEAA